MITFETYAAKICRHAELPPGTHEPQKLNTIVLTLPFGAAHAALDELPPGELPRLGETVSLSQHMQVNFFDVVASPTRELWELTVPVLIRRNLLERLEAWDEWRTLVGFLATHKLQPIVVFQNRPLNQEWYVADVRVVAVP